MGNEQRLFEEKRRKGKEVSWSLAAARNYA